MIVTLSRSVSPTDQGTPAFVSAWAKISKPGSFVLGRARPVHISPSGKNVWSTFQPASFNVFNIAFEYKIDSGSLIVSMSNECGYGDNSATSAACCSSVIVRLVSLVRRSMFSLSAAAALSFAAAALSPARAADSLACAVSASLADIRSLANCSLTPENNIDENVAAATTTTPKISARLDNQNQKSAADEVTENINILTVFGVIAVLGAFGPAMIVVTRNVALSRRKWMRE
jgi:hypothetical protein